MSCVLRIAKNRPYDLYIGTKVSNPNWDLKHSQWHWNGTLSTYRDHILNNKKLLSQVVALEGKSLACWCRPRYCHGDVLLSISRRVQRAYLARVYYYRGNHVLSNLYDSCSIRYNDVTYPNLYRAYQAAAAAAAATDQQKQLQILIELTCIKYDSCSAFRKKCQQLKDFYLIESNDSNLYWSSGLVENYDTRAGVQYWLYPGENRAAAVVMLVTALKLGRLHCLQNFLEEEHVRFQNLERFPSIYRGLEAVLHALPIIDC